MTLLPVRLSPHLHTRRPARQTHRPPCERGRRTSASRVLSHLPQVLCLLRSTCSKLLEQTSIPCLVLTYNSLRPYFFSLKPFSGLIYCLTSGIPIITPPIHQNGRETETPLQKPGLPQLRQLPQSQATEDASGPGTKLQVLFQHCVY